MCYRLLDNCSHIVLDEVHERDVLIDFLMIIIRDLLPKRFVLMVYHVQAAPPPFNITYFVDLI